jgi:4-deoxy-L-threo-5-hexosulose-uronate ketol-isomerase
VVALGVSASSDGLKINDFIDDKAFGTRYFLQRRELGIINLGGKAEIRCKGATYRLDYLDALYLGKGVEDIEFISLEKGFTSLYCLSAPAHHTYPSRPISRAEAKTIELGSIENANARVINQYIHPDVLPTCQLCMGVTHLAVGSVWNTMPAHTHERRMEAYLYFNIKPDQLVVHFMGEPTETRHIMVRNKQLVLSPSWSIHSGCGTQNYSFVWGMLGENQTFDDMDFVDMNQLR